MSLRCASGASGRRGSGRHRSKASLWRTTGDVRDTWSGAGGIITLADETEPLAVWAGPGGWNDPDMLVAGLRGRSRANAAGTIGCTDAEYRTQVSLWAILAAPMFASCDLRTADAATVAALATPGVLAIDQDPMGEPGHRIQRIGSVDVWERRLSDGARAVAVVNRADEGASVHLEWPEAHAGPPEVIDAWTDELLDHRRGQIDLERAPPPAALRRGRPQGPLKVKLSMTTSAGCPSCGAAPRKSHKLMRGFSPPGTGTSAPV
ncbi:MAG: hypothetical protein ACRDGJ_06840 [Candidatus Limnocylindria bacterium]